MAITSPGEMRPEALPAAALVIPKMRGAGSGAAAMVETSPVGPATWSRPAGSAEIDWAAASFGNRAAYGRSEPVALSSTTKSPPRDHPCALGKSGDVVVP